MIGASETVDGYLPLCGIGTVFIFAVTQGYIDHPRQPSFTLNDQDNIK
jgi:hypothetical protein